MDGYIVGTYERADGSTAEYHTSYFRSEVIRDRLADILLTTRIPFGYQPRDAERVGQRLSPEVAGAVDVAASEVRRLVTSLGAPWSWTARSVPVHPITRGNAWS